MILKNAIENVNYIGYTFIIGNVNVKKKFEIYIY